ncbi:nucleotidyltransferase family protein [Sulfurimonas sp. MAG313]|nr:nucleotidyltransferase family protein [Sulfurimonas sp. MAG313]MDF1880470.1 nucleotidyltransferase family protein [Sulfurimonas sp. MAG313]
MNILSPELNLIFQISQSKPNVENIEKLVSQELNQDKLFALSLANGVLPLLHKELSKHKHTPMLNKFKNSANQIKYTNFFMSAQLLQLVLLLKENKINIIPIKGPLLAVHAYSDISLRPSSDLDILAKVKDLVAIAKILESMGYVSEKTTSAFTNPMVLKHFSDISFKHSQTGLIVELHWKLLKSASSTLADIETIFLNAINIPFQNTSLLSLPIEEEFLYLCVHAAKHRFERIEWMNDLNRLFDLYHDTYDWNKLLVIAQKEGYLNPYLLALLILKNHYKMNMSNTKTLKLMAQNKIHKLYIKVLTLHNDNYILKKKNDGIRWMELYFSINLEDSLTAKISHFKAVLFPLYIDDIIKMKSLPKFLSFFIYTKRISRFIFNKNT